MNYLKLFSQYKKAFTMIELIMIMVVFGIVFAFGTQLSLSKQESIEQIDKQFVEMKEQNELNKIKVEKEFIKIDEQFNKLEEEKLAKAKEEKQVKDNLNKVDSYTIEDKYNQNDELKKEESKANIEQFKKDMKLILNIILGIVITTLFFGLFMYLKDLFIDKKNEYFRKKALDEDNELFDRTKYKANYDINYRLGFLSKLNEIDKKVIKDAYKIIKRRESYNIVKDQLKLLYNNSYDIIRQIEDLEHVLKSFKEAQNITNSNFDNDIIEKNNQLIEEIKLNISTLDNLFNQNLNSYSYILINLTKFNTVNINNINEEITNLIKNMVDLNQPIVKMDDLLKKYNI